VIFGILEEEYQWSSFGVDVQGIHNKIGIISDVNEAEGLARRVNADLVIYGDVIVTGDHGLIQPRFYVADTYRSDVSELTGPHKFEPKVEFNTADMSRFNSEVNQKLQSSVLLIEFTKGLAYLAQNDLKLALESIKKAINVADEYGDFEGKEVLYLFASTISRKKGDFEVARSYADQALELNNSYGRAYIALGNIYYDQKDFDEALDYYDQAAGLDDPSAGAFLAEKAHIGSGNVYTSLSLEADKLAKSALAEQALTHYQVAIKAYQTASDARTKAVLGEVAAFAYYGSGLIFEDKKDFESATSAYEQALVLTHNMELKKLAESGLDVVCKRPLKLLC
jgi:tetratricopeptide (TPR) repeat protein